MMLYLRAIEQVAFVGLCVSCFVEIWKHFFRKGGE